MTTPNPTPGGDAPGEPAPAVPAAGVPRRSLGTWRNLLLSMGALGIVVVAWLALVPRVERVEQPAVDVAGTTRQVAADTRTPLLLADLGPDWKATSVRVERVGEGVSTLHAGYHRQPDAQQYVAVVQTLQPTSAQQAQAWITQKYGESHDTMDVGGKVWTRHTAGDPARQVLVGPLGNGTANNPVIVVTGTGSVEDLASAAATLRPVGTGQPSRSSATG